MEAIEATQIDSKVSVNPAFSNEGLVALGTEECSIAYSKAV